MIDTVDILASEYGWAKDYIYDNLYFDEVCLLVDAIRKRRNVHYKMLLAISQSPHTKDPNLLWRTLEAEDLIEGVGEELDTAGFERLKLSTSKNPRIIVK